MAKRRHFYKNIQEVIFFNAFVFYFAANFTLFWTSATNWTSFILFSFFQPLFGLGKRSSSHKIKKGREGEKEREREREKERERKREREGEKERKKKR